MSPAGDRDLPTGVEADRPLSRYTTVRTGGGADFLAQPGTTADLVELLAWARREGVQIGLIGSGSNLLISDDGFRGLAIKLDGDFSTIERDGEIVSLGGAVRLPSAAAKTAAWGLAGLEFGVNIPGTAGGAVRMNANAYGGRLADVIDSVEICDAEGTRRVDPGDLDFAYRSSNLGPAQVVSRVDFRLSPDSPEAIRERLAEMRAWRKETQPSGIKTFGSTFKNPEDPKAGERSAGQLLDEAGCRGLQVGGARFSEVHANFVENMGDATTADVIAVMSAGRQRVAEEFGVLLEPEVQVLGEVVWPEGWGVGR
ncbi:MAG: UDP-N-acetylmuramate dehydrogenase [Solirubrobacterales bacterium]